jgi:hypothetical protein
MPDTPPAAVPGAPQQQPPPFGQSAATQPTQNRGFEAAGLQRLGSVVKQLESLVPMFGAGSEIGKTVMDALQKLVKHVQPGTTSPASEKANIEQMAMRNAQQNQAMQALRQQQAGPPGAGGGAAPPQAPGMQPGRAA